MIPFGAIKVTLGVFSWMGRTKEEGARLGVGFFFRGRHGACQGLSCLRDVLRGGGSDGSGIVTRAPLYSAFLAPGEPSSLLHRLARRRRHSPDHRGSPSPPVRLPRPWSLLPGPLLPGPSPWSLRPSSASSLSSPFPPLPPSHPNPRTVM
jgi:hypothetical protein